MRVTTRARASCSKPRDGLLGFRDTLVDNRDTGASSLSEFLRKLLEGEQSRSIIL